MPPFKIDFDSLDWQSALPGIRFKVHREGSRQIRLVEFSADFVEPHWCEKGHIGLVVEGTLEIDFRGRVIPFETGAALFIAGGPSTAHKARATTPIARLVLVEDAGTARGGE